jgi:hypothetical protein
MKTPFPAWLFAKTSDATLPQRILLILKSDRVFASLRQNHRRNNVKEWTAELSSPKHREASYVADFQRQTEFWRVTGTAELFVRTFRRGRSNSKPHAIVALIRNATFAIYSPTPSGPLCCSARYVVACGGHVQAVLSSRARALRHQSLPARMPASDETLTLIGTYNPPCRK